MAGRDTDKDAKRASGKGGGRALAAVALVVLAGFVAAVWYAYDQGVKQGATITPPLIKADTRPTKVRPDDPGGLVVPDQDKLIYQAIEGNGQAQRVERLLPPPEEPVVRPKAKAEPDVAVAVGELAAVPPGGTAPAPPPLPEEREAPKPVPRVATTEPAAPVAPTPAPPPPASQGSGYRIQIASYRDPDAATAGWARLLRANPKLLGPLSPNVVKADLGPGKGIFYRLTAGPIADKDAADALCQELKLKRVGCLVVDR